MKIPKETAQIILSAMMIFFAASLASGIRTNAGSAPVIDSIILLLLAWAGLMASRLNLIVGSVLLFVSAAVPFILFRGDYTTAVFIYFGLYLFCALLLLLSWFLSYRTAKKAA